MQHCKKICFVTLMLFSLIAFAYALFIEPNRIGVRHLAVEDDALNRVLKGKTAVHITDLHINTIGKRERAILKIIDDLKPDLIFLTGDYVQWKGRYDGALNFLSRLSAPLGVWAVMGDYDYSSSRESCRFCHEPGCGRLTQQHQVKFLRNRADRISFSNGTVWLGGIDPESALEEISGVPELLPQDKAPTIMLGHNPLLFDSVDANHDVLILAGDTHGGQIPLPAWLWRIMGYEKNARYSHGFFQEGMKKMYVSRGLGTSHLPVRFLRPPELVVLHF